MPTSHAAKIDAIFAAGLLNRFEALKYLLLLFKEKNPARLKVVNLGSLEPNFSKAYKISNPPKL